MAIRTGSIERKVAASVDPHASVGFDWTTVILGAWFQFGVYLDGWAHVHFPLLETFVTPWHGVLYSGFLALAVFTVGALVRNRARGAAWKRALPAGYGFSLLGVVLFVAGALADLVWHRTFGIESTAEALLSPTHLLLGLGGTLIWTGPLRAAWWRTESRSRSWVARLPMVLSLAFLLSALTFFTQYSHPLARPWAALGNRPTAAMFPLQAPDPPIRGGTVSSTVVGHSMGVAGILLQTGLLMGVVLLAVRRWGGSLPTGSLTIVFTVNASLMGFMRDQMMLIPSAALAGIVGDLLLKRLDPSPASPGALRLFAFVVPAMYYLLYFLALMLTRGIWWSVHLWTGSIALAGVVGWLLSYLVVPPGRATSP